MLCNEKSEGSCRIGALYLDRGLFFFFFFLTLAQDIDFSVILTLCCAAVMLNFVAYIIHNSNTIALLWSQIVGGAKWAVQSKTAFIRPYVEMRSNLFRVQ